MKKIFAILLAVMLMASVVVPASAAAVKVPKVPDLSKINITQSVQNNVRAMIPANFWDNWFAEHPIKIDLSGIKFNFG